jgi:hypothetical protein
MSEVEINDNILDNMAKDYAEKILEQTQDYDVAQELAHQYADGSEWAIDTQKAHTFYQDCKTKGGEKYLDACWPNTKMSYDDLTSIVVYGEIRSRIMSAIDKQIRGNPKLDQNGSVEVAAEAVFSQF